MRCIAAQYLFTGTTMLRHGVVTVDETGQLLAVGQLADTETCSTEFYNGILAPGFVNAHCHVELSHFRGAIPPKKGMTHFIESLKDWNKRTVPNEQSMHAAMQQIDNEMHDEGIVAVGDICNTTHSFNLKARSQIFYHSFVEAVGLAEELAQEKMTETGEVWKEALRMRLPTSITPHALYSMSPTLLNYAVDAAKKSGILSIHNQESVGEDSDGLYRLLAMLDASTRLLLVHNTYTTAADIDRVNQTTSQAVWVLCPNSNLHITGSLPPADILYKQGLTVALGTDSLASNTQLSILEEMKTLSHYFPQIPLEVLLKWGTLGGATALNKANELGSLIPDRRSGLVLIEGVDFANMRLLSTAKARRV